MIRLLHLTDLHLGAKFNRLGAKGNVRRKDLSDAFSRAIEFALSEKNKIDVVLISGDIFDHHVPPNKEAELFRAEIDRLKKRGINCVIIPGNHDGYEYTDSVWRDELPWVHLLREPAMGEPLTIPLNGTDCHFYGFAFDSQLSKPPFDEFKRKESDGFHIALLHGSLIDGSQFEMHLRNVPLERRKLASSGMDYIALGHYHNFQEVDENGVKIVYPGTLEGLNFGEDGERQLVVVEFSDKGVSLTKESFNKRTLLSDELNLNGSEDAASEVRTKLSELASENLLLQLKLTGTIGSVLDVAALRAAYEEQFFYLDLRDETSIVDSELIKLIQSENNVRGAFVTMLMDGMDDLDEREKKVRELALRKGLESLGGIG